MPQERIGLDESAIFKLSPLQKVVRAAGVGRAKSCVVSLLLVLYNTTLALLLSMVLECEAAMPTQCLHKGPRQRQRQRHTDTDTPTPTQTQNVVLVLREGGTRKKDVLCASFFFFLLVVVVVVVVVVVSEDLVG